MEPLALYLEPLSQEMTALISGTYVAVSVISVFLPRSEWLQCADKLSKVRVQTMDDTGSYGGSI